ncbi:MAG: MarR family transcriptional regulator [Clostridiales bacterium]|jgi:DNA-binding MarR family transcriptional regulator|nr:MarR family transcriptional regulator [Clostridiales bacterium]
MNKEERVIMEYMDLFNKMVWLNKVKMEAALKGYKASEIHFIEYIEKNAESNVTRLAESFYMTGGAISKIAKKLIKKGVVESYRKPDNKKELYFRLTEQGKALYKIHEGLHKEFQERDRVVFDRITEEQFDIMLGFAERYGRHLDAEIKKAGAVVKAE